VSNYLGEYQLEKQMDTFRKVVVNPAIENITSVFFWGGVSLVFLGAIFGDSFDNLPFVPSGSGESLLKIGSAVLGAGVFAIIMKSAQFTEIFQKHIFEVFYDPEKSVPGTVLKGKWIKLTNALLKEVLPKSHLDASKKIEQQFLDSELTYHFEDYYNSYTITIDEEKNKAIIELFSKSSVILSPNFSDPCLIQSIEADGVVELKALRFDGADVLDENSFIKDTKNPKKNILKIPLNEYARERDNGDRISIFERVTKWEQDLSVDPYIKANISRYIKGARIRVKVSKGYKVFFERFGLGELPKNHYLNDDGEGYERWELVEPNGLLLPGQGFILVVIPVMEKE
tara:strand:- start:4850 stop:5875 length:1026 start_codon:yes stop_codon:yes gene_type:complete